MSQSIESASLCRGEPTAVVRGAYIYRRTEISYRIGGITKHLVYWRCHDREGVPMHHGSFENLGQAIRQTEGPIEGDTP